MMSKHGFPRSVIDGMLILQNVCILQHVHDEMAQPIEVTSTTRTEGEDAQWKVILQFKQLWFLFSIDCLVLLFLPIKEVKSVSFSARYKHDEQNL